MKPIYRRFLGLMKLALKSSYFHLIFCVCLKYNNYGCTLLICLCIDIAAMIKTPCTCCMFDYNIIYLIRTVTVAIIKNATLSHYAGNIWYFFIFLFFIIYFFASYINNYFNIVLDRFFDNVFVVYYNTSCLLMCFLNSEFLCHSIIRAQLLVQAIAFTITSYVENFLNSSYLASCTLAVMSPKFSGYIIIALQSRICKIMSLKLPINGKAVFWLLHYLNDCIYLFMIFDAYFCLLLFIFNNTIKMLDFCALTHKLK